MRTAVTVITDDGRVAVPADVQQQLGVGADDPVEWVIEDDGTVRVTRAGRLTLESVRGAAGSLREPMPWSDMLQIAREDAARAMPGEHGR